MSRRAPKPKTRSRRRPDRVGLVSGKVAIVTGGASGIGAATAALLEREGARVWRADIDGAADLALDVTDPEAWTRAIDLVVADAGGIDILVNAAGIAAAGGAATVGQVALEDWRRVFAVNVEGTLLGCQQAMRVMGREREGAIVNIASTAAVAPSPALAAYGASKAAVVQLTRSVAAASALAGQRLRCNCVMPGMVDTPMTAAMPADYRAAWIAQIPQDRFAQADEVAGAILYLASGLASYVNGAALPVDGGLLARPVVSLARKPD